MRFHLSIEAGNDIAEIAEYLRTIPSRAGVRIGKSLQSALHLLAKYPYLAHGHEELSSFTGRDIRCIVDGEYVIFLTAERTPVLFLGVIHGKRDVLSVMRRRLS